MFTRGYRGIKSHRMFFIQNPQPGQQPKDLVKSWHMRMVPRWKHAYEYYEYNRKYNYINGNPKSLGIPMSHQVVLCLTYLKRNMYRNIRESTELGKSMKIPGFSFVQTHPWQSHAVTCIPLRPHDIPLLFPSHPSCLMVEPPFFMIQPQISHK
jgi:hypothetical protein